MNKKIRVLLDFGITKKIHTMYNSYFENPPAGTIYQKSEFLLIGNKSFNIFRRIYLILKKIGIFPEGFIRVTRDNLRKEQNFDKSYIFISDVFISKNLNGFFFFLLNIFLPALKFIISHNRLLVNYLL